jgi:hypothetical protein
LKRAFYRIASGFQIAYRPKTGLLKRGVFWKDVPAFAPFHDERGKVLFVMTAPQKLL